MTSQLHHADVIIAMPTVQDDITIASCWRHPYPSQPRGSGRLVFRSGQPIWAKKTRATRGALLCAWPDTLPARDGDFDIRFRHRFHQWLRLFLLYTVVWLKHNFDNFHFWAKIKHHFKLCALVPIVGNSDRWCTDNCLLEATHTNTIFNVVRKIIYIHGKVNIIRDRERIQNKYMEEEDHFTLLYS
jgi:hypothetical protein